MKRLAFVIATLTILPLGFVTGCGDSPAADEPSELHFTHERPAFKAIVLLHKRADMTWEEYESYYLNEHVPFVLEIPGVRGWVVNLAVHGEEPAPYDGIAEFWFDDLEAFEHAMASPEVAATLEDAETFVAPPGPRLMVVQEHVMIPPGAAPSAAAGS